jgi:hypothetical protein
VTITDGDFMPILPRPPPHLVKSPWWIGGGRCLASPASPYPQGFQHPTIFLLKMLERSSIIPS